MSDVKLNLEAQIAQIEQKNQDGQKASHERNRKLRELKNELALASAKLWVVCSYSFDEEPAKHMIAGASDVCEARIPGFGICYDGNYVMLRHLGLDCDEEVRMHVAVGTEICLTKTERHGKQKIVHHHILYVFDTLSAALAHFEDCQTKTTTR